MAQPALHHGRALADHRRPRLVGEALVADRPRKVRRAHAAATLAAVVTAAECEALAAPVELAAAGAVPPRRPLEGVEPAGQPVSRRGECGDGGARLQALGLGTLEVELYRLELSGGRV